MSNKVILGMSGGVDSSVAATLLQEQGFEVVGATMKTFCYQGTAGATKTCCGLDGIMDAKSVANKLGIQHHVFNVEEEFTRDVIDNFVSEYADGRTPIPCVRCNSFSKFKDLFDRGALLGCRMIATGHYVRKAQKNGKDVILRGEYLPKDQSYFLWGIPANRVKRMLFPIGQFTKPEIRALAAEKELSTANKPESMEICFVPDGDYAGFLATRLGDDHAALSKGKIVDESGKQIGEHDGYARYTVGQRKGLPGGQQQKLYVLGTIPSKKEVVVGTRQSLYASEVRIGQLNWLFDAPKVGDRVQVQVRHRAAPANATVKEMGDEIVLTLDKPEFAVTPGQSGVIYLPFADETDVFQMMAGGGVIMGSS